MKTLRGPNGNLVTRPPPQEHDTYCQTSDVRRTLVGNKIVDHSDVVGASPVGAAASNCIFIIDLITGFNGLGKDNIKTRKESFQFYDLVCLILEILR